ncbi:MAG TPA: extracellular solute-binding protein [Candidatus Scatomonas pullistercoris]|mgnify:CR=1 FL=1|uniref:Extracellular solute-binding protein n=1 Tax=Candidatus Scatomonas pullistercoris TaxID=2840920 RepID=A0A9D1P552_9FIRM|nr:extracellular solute-binding protein [Candidatus Scatomonas pullistercoris]
MRRKGRKNLSLLLAAAMGSTVLLSGCGDPYDGKTHIEIINYKQEATEYFDALEDEFNATHDDIHLTIDSPNDASTILRTRFIREDYPDIIGIGGDINYSYYIDAEILADVSDYPGLADIKQSYLDIGEALEIVPTEGTYGVPYAANAAGVLYNRDMFEEHGWEIPTTWDELIALCEEIQAEGILPLEFGFLDRWTCLAPWNALAVDLAPSDVCKQVNRGETTFTEEYREAAEKYIQLIEYGPDDPVAYSYNDACTAFARGEAAMYPIGSYAVPQILSVNPDMNIDSFVMPGSNDPEENTLNSGIDLQFCVTAACPNKEAAYEVLDFLLQDDVVQQYITDQNSIPCKEGDFELASQLDGMMEYIESGNMTDYQDHYYPSEMAVDGQLQTFVQSKDVDAFLERFDREWPRYNRDIIRTTEEYEAEHSSSAE